MNLSWLIVILYRILHHYIDVTQSFCIIHFTVFSCVMCDIQKSLEKIDTFHICTQNIAIFNICTQNIDRRYMFDEYPQSLFWIRKKENCIPLYILVSLHKSGGLRAFILHEYVFLMSLMYNDLTHAAYIFSVSECVCRFVFPNWFVSVRIWL